MRLRMTSPAEDDAVAAVHQRAFGSEIEAHLARALMHDDAYLPAFSFAAEEADGLVGHILVTRARLTPDDGTAPVPLLLICPLAVAPERQGRGVGSALVGHVASVARAAGERAVLVLGDPAYYGRFGFVPAGRWGLRAPYPVREDAWQVLELTSGACDGAAGTVMTASPLDDPELWRAPDEEGLPTGM